MRKCYAEIRAARFPAEARNERIFKAQHYDAHQLWYETPRTFLLPLAFGFMNIRFHEFPGNLVTRSVPSDTPRQLFLTESAINSTHRKKLNFAGRR